MKLGGLGIRRAVQIVLSAYLGSVTSSTDLMCVISPAYIPSIFTCMSPLLMLLWPSGQRTMLDPPQGSTSCKQKVWDDLLTAASVSSLLESAQDDGDCARLLACIAKESGAWLQALPI